MAAIIKTPKEKNEVASGRYIEAIGRRKTAAARVRLYKSAHESFIINDKELAEYFPVSALQSVVLDPFVKVGLSQKFNVSAHIQGGGISAQAEALRHGIARALVLYDSELRGQLKKAGFLKRDPREKERKKFGLKKARKAPQWSKR